MQFILKHGKYQHYGFFPMHGRDVQGNVLCYFTSLLNATHPNLKFIIRGAPPVHCAYFFFTREA